LGVYEQKEDAVVFVVPPMPEAQAFKTRIVEELGEILGPDRARSFFDKSYTVLHRHFGGFGTGERVLTFWTDTDGEKRQHRIDDVLRFPDGGSYRVSREADDFTIPEKYRHLGILDEPGKRDDQRAKP
jgi:hypothetical protein